MTNVFNPDVLKELAAALAEANARITQMHAQMIDYFEDYYAVLDDECAPGEKHCKCVPHLRRRIAELEGEQLNVAELLTQLSSTQMRLHEAEAQLAAMPDRP